MFRPQHGSFSCPLRNGMMANTAVGMGRCRAGDR